MPKKAQQDFISLNAAVLTISDTRVAENDTSGDLISDRLQQANHNVVKRIIEKENAEKLFLTFRSLVDDPAIDVIISSGGTGLTQHDVAPEVTSRLVDKPIPGFGELFRMLSYNEIGPSTIESRAEAGVANGTLVFLLPGSPGACQLAMESIVLNQLDARTRPCNLVTLLPRIPK